MAAVAALLIVLTLEAENEDEAKQRDDEGKRYDDGIDKSLDQRVVEEGT